MKRNEEKLYPAPAFIRLRSRSSGLRREKLVSLKNFCKLLRRAERISVDSFTVLKRRLKPIELNFRHRNHSIMLDELHNVGAANDGTHKRAKERAHNVD